MKPFHFALILLVACLVAIWQVSIIPESNIQMTVGPVLAPAVVVGLLTLLSMLYVISAYQGKQPDETLTPDETPLEGSRVRLLVFMCGVLLFNATVEALGFIPATTFCAMCVASSFRDHVALLQAFKAFMQKPRDHVWTLCLAFIHDQLKAFFICAVIAISFWYLFAKVLGVNLGMAFIFFK